MTSGMRVLFSEGSRVVQDVSIYYGGMGPTTVGAARTCEAIMSRSESSSGRVQFWLSLRKFSS